MQERVAMPKKKYQVDLSSQERTTLELLVQRGKSRARQLTRARILLQAEEGLTDEEIAMALDVGIATVERRRPRLVEANLEALNERPRPSASPTGPCSCWPTRWWS
jgi:DNA-directed RNA polymerase specialized sigma24 family protein